MVDQEIHVPMVELTRYSPKRNESRNLTVVRYTRYNKEDEEIGNYYMTPSLRALMQEEGVRVLRQNGKPVMIMVNDKVFHLLTENIDRQLAIIRSRIAASRLLNNGVSPEARELMIEMHRLNKSGEGDLESIRYQIRNSQSQIDLLEENNRNIQELLAILQDDEKRKFLGDFLIDLRECGVGYSTIRGINITNGLRNHSDKYYWFDRGVANISQFIRRNNEDIERARTVLDRNNKLLEEALAALETGDDVHEREVDKFIEVMKSNPLFKELFVDGRRLVLKMKESIWWQDETSGFLLPEVDLGISISRYGGGRSSYNISKLGGSHPHCHRNNSGVCLGGFSREFMSYDLMQTISMLFQWKNSINPNDTLNHLCNFQRVTR